VVEREGRQAVSFTNLGLTCIGPNGSSESLVTQHCPHEVTIDLDTARIFLASWGLRLGPRCIVCSICYQVTRFFQSIGVELHAADIICTHPRCDQRSFNRSGRCPQHLSSLIRGIRKNKTTIDLKAARRTFESTAQKQWAFPPSYNIIRDRVEEIQQGKRPGSDLVILDDEFSPASRQLWEFAIIERVSGNILINTIINHKNLLDHN
jgi:hypothetical protein